MLNFSEERTRLLGREPWSSGNGRRLIFERPWLRIEWMDMTFFHIDMLLKLYCLLEKTENKRKRGRVGQFFIKEQNYYFFRRLLFFPKLSCFALLKEVLPLFLSQQIFYLRDDWTCAFKSFVLTARKLSPKKYVKIGHSRPLFDNFCLFNVVAIDKCPT